MDTNFFDYFFMWLDFRIIDYIYIRVALESIYYKPCNPLCLDQVTLFIFKITQQQAAPVYRHQY